MVAAMGPATCRGSFNERFKRIVRGNWSDSMGYAITVAYSRGDYSRGDCEQLTAVLTPLVAADQQAVARSRSLKIKRERAPDRSTFWSCGDAVLEWVDECKHRLVWTTADGRRSIWSRSAKEAAEAECYDNEPDNIVAFPWLLTSSPPMQNQDMPSDIIHDGARIAALLDIRQMIGARREAQERLTHILMDHDLHPGNGDYLVPGAESTLWQTLPVLESLRRNITDRIRRIPHEANAHCISWSSDAEVRVGHHRIDLSTRRRDIATLEARWALPADHPHYSRKRLEIGRLLALYSVFDNPLSNKRSGMQLALAPDIRCQCDYELFASPLNAVVPNGRFASKWPHIEWRFGSLGSYPSVLQTLEIDTIVCVNPPFTEAYLNDVMSRLAELKLRFRLRLAVPILDVPWRKKLQNSLPSAQLLHTYYDATNEQVAETMTPTLLWEDPRCPPRWPTSGPLLRDDGDYCCDLQI
mmetsp:Transcript_150514/g.288438  ORF Transcript_150514/g.288438 Transcript_150514/m.288438 type:complete len:469 (-) Transcript_150514:11-1417(-)